MSSFGRRAPWRTRISLLFGPIGGSVSSPPPDDDIAERHPAAALPDEKVSGPGVPGADGGSLATWLRKESSSLGGVFRQRRAPGLPYWAAVEHSAVPAQAWRALEIWEDLASRNRRWRWSSRWWPTPLEGLPELVEEMVALRDGQQFSSPCSNSVVINFPLAAIPGDDVNFGGFFEPTATALANQTVGTGSGAIPAADHADATAVSHWSGVLRAVCRITGRVSQGNRVTVLPGGEAFIKQALLPAVAGARRHVWIESYIFDGSEICQQVGAALVEARSRGCDVVLLVDWLGSLTLDSARLLRQLSAAGITVVEFNPPAPLARLSRRQLAFRDHRKVAVVDDVAFCGSCNFSKDAVSIIGKSGTESEGGSATRQAGGGVPPRFFDIHLKFEGPCVAHIAESFCDVLATAVTNSAGVTPAPRLPPFPPPAEISRANGGGAVIAVLESNRRRRVLEIQAAFELLLRSARQRVTVTTSYFTPPKFLKRALRHSMIHSPGGVSLLLTGNSDVWGDVQTTNYVLSKLLRRSYSARTRAYMTINRHCHAKVITVDNLWAIVGTFNWDRSSANRNLEIAVAILDPTVVQQLDMIHLNATLSSENREELRRRFAQELELRRSKELSNHKGLPMKPATMAPPSLVLRVAELARLPPATVAALQLSKEDLLSSVHMLCDLELDTVEVTETRRKTTPSWQEFVMYRLTRWAGGVGCDQFLGPERPLDERHTFLVEQSKARGLLIKWIRWLLL